MARTGQPATRQVAAVQRAIAILDELAEAPGRAGHQRDRPPHRHQREHDLADPGHARERRAGRARPVDRALPARRGVVRLANAAGDLDIRSLARPHLEELASRIGETATLSVPGGHEAFTLDFVQSPLDRAQRGRGGPDQRRARDRGGQGVPRLRREAARPGRCGLHRADDRGARRPGGRAGRGPGAGLGPGGRGAGGGPERGRGAGARPRPASWSAILGVQGPAVRFSPRAMRSAVGCHGARRAISAA